MQNVLLLLTVEIAMATGMVIYHHLGVVAVVILITHHLQIRDLAPIIIRIHVISD
jgi:hypothetical protein